MQRQICLWHFERIFLIPAGNLYRHDCMFPCGGAPLYPVGEIGANAGRRLRSGFARWSSRCYRVYCRFDVPPSYIDCTVYA